ncbi:hypothetical protein [Hyphococcus lacteus]|uniref:Uncharacterized protein n=1 Tax=Hyphococcus lacteus TaxID=3143536 RepID=A0ABV3Z0J6_9PROT
MENEMNVPAGFEALRSFAKWNLMTADERTAARREASTEELKEFYDAILPHIEAVLDECDKFELGELPESHRGIFNIALSMAEIAPHIEFYKGDPGVPFAFEEERFIAVHGSDETWQALPPNGPR